MSAIGPMFGQVGFFHKFAGKDYEDKRPLQRYVGESQRLLGVLDQRLSKNRWLLGDEYSIADISTFPWIGNLIGFYNAGDLVGISGFPHVTRALNAFTMRPAVQRGNAIPQRNP
jgi:GST-like protein